MRRVRQSRSKRQTAERLVSLGQLLLLILVGYGLYYLADRWGAHNLLVDAIKVALGFYTVFVGMKLVLHIAASVHRPPGNVIALDNPETLPSYTIFVPLYKEGEMLPRLVEAIGNLRYPKDRIQVLLLLEEDDAETRDVAARLKLPDYFEIVDIPDYGPRTKPKACNIGLARATGDLCVIFDAEDRPEPNQLLKAVAGFRTAKQGVVCLQARLAFWNGDSNWVTRLYWAEYVVHFDWVLRGMAKLGVVPPLGGTSNHFITEKLREVAFDPEQLPKGAEGIGGWDPWNVTEDAELAGALAMNGYRVEMFDSVTYEEATMHLRRADRQRRRWLKGYAQTGLVYTRRPLTRIRRMGIKNFLFYNLLMLGTPLSLVLNPIFWALTIMYIVTQSDYIERLFPPPMFYAGVFIMVVGNFLLFYQLVAAVLHRDGEGGVKFMLLAPLWWAFTSWSAYWAIFELLIPSKRSFWHKTKHGHDLDKEKDKLELRVA